MTLSSFLWICATLVLSSDLTNNPMIWSYHYKRSIPNWPVTHYKSNVSHLQTFQFSVSVYERVDFTHYGKKEKIAEFKVISKTLKCGNKPRKNNDANYCNNNYACEIGKSLKYLYILQNQVEYGHQSLLYTETVEDVST